MLYLTCTTISDVDLAQYGVSLAKDWVSVECGTNSNVYYSSALWRNHISHLSVVQFFFQVRSRIIALFVKVPIHSWPV